MIRVVTFTVGSAGDPVAISEILSDLAPDVVCLSGPVQGRRLKVFSRNTPLLPVVRAVHRGMGTAVLATERVRVRATDRFDLAGGRRHDRPAAHAILSVGGGRLAVTAVQFGTSSQERREQLRQLEAQLRGVEPPLVIGASMNEPVTGPVARALAATLQDAFAVAGSGVGDTYPASGPVSRRDFVFVDQRLRVRRCTVASGPGVASAGAHRPVVADIDEQPRDSGVSQ